MPDRRTGPVVDVPVTGDAVLSAITASSASRSPLRNTAGPSVVVIGGWSTFRAVRRRVHSSRGVANVAPPCPPRPGARSSPT